MHLISILQKRCVFNCQSCNYKQLLKNACDMDSMCTSLDRLNTPFVTSYYGKKIYKSKSRTHLSVKYSASDNQNDNKHKGTQQSTNCHCNLSITVSSDFFKISKNLLQ